MADEQKLTAETLTRMAAEVLGFPLRDEDAQPTADLLNSLAADLAALRAMEIADDEPATTYDAGAEVSDTSGVRSAGEPRP